MCDYSREGDASRDARVGDQLVTAEVGEHGCIGLVSPNDPDVSVCLLPGSRLKVIGNVPQNLQSEMFISTGDRATFTKRDRPTGRSRYQDSLHFDAHVASALVLIQDLLGGVEFEVLSVPADQVDVPDAPAAATRERELELA